MNARQLATVTQAQSAMGEGHFFGPDEWAKFLGGQIEIGAVPEIPWTEDELRHPGVSQPTFLFLGIENLDAMSWEMPAFVPGVPKFDQILSWYVDQVRAATGGTLRTRWYQMPVRVVTGLWNLTYAAQVSSLPAGYEVPTAPERFTANILYHLLNNDYLDDWLHDARTRTERQQPDGGGTLYRLIRIDDSSGTALLTTREGTDAAVSNFGIAASRRMT